jgi:hypothetical protein
MSALSAPSAAVPARPRSRPAARRLATALVHGLQLVLRSQLRTGEIPSYGRGEDGEPLYRLSPLASALAHDALACLDPTSPRFEPGAPPLFGPPAAARWAGLTAAHLRRHIRGFLAWQQLPDGRFGYFGRGSGLPPDAATTACAGAVLLAARVAAGRRRPVAPRPAGEAPVGGAARALAALRAHRAGAEQGGRFFTFVDAEGRGWSTIARDGRRGTGFDRVVNAHVLRFLALAGEPGEPIAGLADWLAGEAARGDLAEGSPDHPDPMVFVHAVSRAFAPTGLPGRAEVAAALAPRVLALERPGGGFGGPFATALALTALLDLAAGAEGDLLERLAERLGALGAALLEHRPPAGGWAAEGYVRQGGGSPGLTSAFAVAALARLGAALPEQAP